MREPDTTSDVPEWQLQITERVRILLAHQRRSQRELAQAMGLTPSQLSRSMTREGTHRREWRVPDLLHIADFFEVQPGDLVNGDLTKLLGLDDEDEKPGITL